MTTLQCDIESSYGSYDSYFHKWIATMSHNSNTFKIPNSYELFVSIWYILFHNAEIFFHL